MKLGASFGAAAEMATAGRYMAETSLEKVNILTLSILDCIQKTISLKEKEFVVRIDGQDVAHTFHSEINDLIKWAEFINKERMKEVANTGEDLEQDILEHERDPSYLLEEPESISEGSIAEPTDEEGEELKEKVKKVTKRKG